MSLTPTSSLDDIVQEIKRTSDYDVLNDAQKAREHLIACRYYLATVAQETESTGERVRLDLSQVKQMYDDAKAWLETNDRTFSSTSPDTTYQFKSVENYR